MRSTPAMGGTIRWLLLLVAVMALCLCVVACTETSQGTLAGESVTDAATGTDGSAAIQGGEETTETGPGMSLDQWLESMFGTSGQDTVTEEATETEDVTETAGGDTADGETTDTEPESTADAETETVTEPETETQPDWDALYPSRTDHVLTWDNLFQVGEGKNVIVFLVDRFDGRYVDILKRERPDYLNSFADFTYYSNNISSYSRTYPAVGAMLSGQLRDFAEGSTANGYFEAAYQNSPLLTTLKGAGYAINLYTADYYACRNARVFRGLADNIAPNVDGVNFYDTLDYEVYAKLTEGLTLGDTPNTFTFLHLQGMHTPYKIDENGQKPSSGTTLGAVLGGMNMVKLYIQQLKAMGLYENSTIIITGDHPDPISDYNEPTRARPTALFVKRAGMSHPYRESSAPVSDMDLIPSILESTMGDGKDYGTAYWEVAEDAVRPRYHYFVLNSEPSGNETMTVYEITGDAKDFAAWKRLFNVTLNGRFYR